MSDLTWSPQQAAALDKVGAWLADPDGPQVFRLFGYAGTGKTTLARHLAQHCRIPLFAAFTGKAASVLRDKGCANATTLHSLLYNLRDRDTTKLAKLKTEMEALPPNHPDYPEAVAEYRLEQDRIKRPWFHVNPDSQLRHADLLVVDEVSMVDEKLGRDIESFKKKILVLGDPAQLPPIRGGGYFTNAKPDVLLTEIHRQAADNPILRWATLVRKGEIIPYGDLGLAKKFRREQIDNSWLARGAGQILCGRNETRQKLNALIRKELGKVSPFPEYKDRLVMLMNNHKLGVLNGTVCRAQCAAVEADRPDHFWLNIHYEGRILFDQRVDAAPFLGKEPSGNRDWLQLDFGYALTVHKSQGSQWPIVTLMDDGFGKREPEERRRWLYTAITRAETQLYIVTS